MSSPGPADGKQFDFGENWISFAGRALTPQRLEEAARAFQRLFDRIELRGKSFLDIGFGQGLSLINAHREGAVVVGTDINPKCREALRRSAAVAGSGIDCPLVEGSILDPLTQERLRAASPEGDGFYDVVHAWGSLHHTGAMWKAIDAAAALVRPGGHLILAIYHPHWSSPGWSLIKWAHVHASPPLRKLLEWTLLPPIAVAKWLVTGFRNPFRQDRGMDFYHDLVDWIGGYPYEYATPAQIARHLGSEDWQLGAVFPPQVPTGCSEMVFARVAG
ncbi:MAG: methyltransferase domain-containing protein [Verrucomicrobia bacterium]|nr:methyltransferase domain-containing protein [Verrucomicrobiota bacterium]